MQLLKITLQDIINYNAWIYILMKCKHNVCFIHQATDIFMHEGEVGGTLVGGAYVCGGPRVSMAT